MDTFLFDLYRISTLCVLVLITLQRRKPLTLRCAGLFIVAYFLTGCIDLYYYLMPYQTVDVLAVLIELSILILYSHLVTECEALRTIITGLGASIMVQPGFLVSRIIYTLTGEVGPALLVFTVFCIVLTAIAWYYRPIIHDILAIESANWKMIAIVTTIAYVATFLIFINPVDITDTNGLMADVVVLILLGLLIGAVLSLVRRSYLSAEQKLDMDDMRIYAESLRREVNNQQERENEMAILRHDIRHNAVLIKGFLEAGEVDKVLQLLDEEISNTKLQKSKKYCENIALNGILRIYAQRAEQHKIRLEVDTYFPEHLGVDEFELAVAVSNLLENAFHAVEEQFEQPEDRYVRIVSHQKLENILLVISNPVTKPIVLVEDTNLPDTSNCGPGHGYGTRSIKMFAEQNHALLTYSNENGEVIVRMLFPLGKTDEQSVIPSGSTSKKPEGSV